MIRCIVCGSEKIEEYGPPGSGLIKCLDCGADNSDQNIDEKIVKTKIAAKPTKKEE